MCTGRADWLRLGERAFVDTWLRGGAGRAHHPEDDTPARAEPPKEPAQPEAGGNEAAWGDRTLDGHRFLLPAAQDSGFVMTQFGFRQGGVYVQVPDFPAADSGIYTLNLIGLTEQLDLSIKVTDWLGVFGEVEGIAFVGVDAPGFVFGGGEFRYGGRFGLVARPLRIRESGTQFAVRLDYGVSTGRVIDVQRLITEAQRVGRLAAADPSQAPDAETIEDLIESGVLDLVLVPSTASTHGGSIHAAQALSPYAGLQASFRLERRGTRLRLFDAVTRTYLNAHQTIWAYSGAFSLTADGSPAGLPIATMLEYRVSGSTIDSAQMEGPVDTPATHLVGGGLYYSGQRDLQLGLFGSTVLNTEPVPGFGDDVGESSAPLFVFGQFVFRYIW